jgi:hypothetical protein
VCSSVKGKSSRCTVEYKSGEIREGKWMVARLSALLTGHTLLPRNIIFFFWYTFFLEAE